MLVQIHLTSEKHLRNVGKRTIDKVSTRAEQNIAVII